MSRYIDADMLKNKLQQHHDFFVNAWGGFMGMPIQDKARCDELSNSIAEIFNAPSIDIITCAECKFKRLYDGETKYYYCALEDRPNRQWSVDDWNYCCWGERKENG